MARNPKKQIAPPDVTTASASDDPPLTTEDLNYLKFLDAHGGKVGLIDPLSDEGLRLQALYVQHFSTHPTDVLRRIMENPYSDPKDRMSAAKTLLEYSQRKPTTTLTTAITGSMLNLDPAKLQALSAKEQALLEVMLGKLL